MGKISIIIPVYNAENSLTQSIKSVLTQSFDDIELILIDDGSVDNSAKIIDQYASKNEKVIAIHQPNKGVSKARNVGIEKASGKWIYFLDSDDWIEPDYLLNFINNAEGFDLIIQGFTKEYENMPEKQNITFCPIQSLQNYEVIEMLQHRKDAHNGYLWHRLFKRSIIEENHIRFVEGCNFAEDGLFFLQYMKFVEKTNILNTLGHHYTIRQTSLTSRKYDARFYLDMAGMYYDALTDIHGNRTYKLFSQQYVWQLLFYWIICNLKKDYDLNKAIILVLHFLHKRKISHPLFSIKALQFVSSISGLKLKRTLLQLYIEIEKKRINIYKK